MDKIKDACIINKTYHNVFRSIFLDYNGGRTLAL